MSKVQIRQIRRKIEETFRPCLSTEESIKLNENMFLSRGLAAYSVLISTGCSPNEAWDSLTDGGDDNGIDAIFYHEDSAKLFLVQSKWIHSGNGEPDNSSIKKFVSGINLLTSLEFEEFNEKIKNREEEIIQALENPSINIVAIIVYSGSSDLSRHSQTDLDRLLNELNDTSDVFSWKQLDQGKLHASLVSSYASPINLEIRLNNWGKVDEPHLAYYGQIPGPVLAEMWKSYGDKVVARNLRGPLGTTDVNEEIRYSLDKNPELFWYFNNGVTATAKSVQKLAVNGAKKDYGIFKCDDISIVNGAQTMSSIGEFVKKNPTKSIEDCTVHFRVISISDGGSEFGNDVTRTNNRQNKIESRDFVSQDDEQKRLRKELLIEDVQYHILRNDDTSRGARSFDVQDSTTALACASGDVSMVVTLKSQIGKLWDDITKPPYRALFNPSTSGLYVWRCVQVQRYINRAIEKRSKDYKKPRQRKILVYGNRIIAAIIFKKIDTKKLHNADYDFEKEITEEYIYEISHNVIYQLIEFCQRFYPTAMIPNLFKNQEKCKNIFESVFRVL